MRKIRKIISVIERGLIKATHYINHRFYMRLYIRYIKKIGIVLNGVPEYIHPSVIFDGKAYSQTFLGNHVVISRDVLFLNHDYSLSCALRAMDGSESKAHWVKNIKVGNNVFIGARCLILPGTNIGNNCIIGGGAVVKGCIPENSIVCGNPAKIIANTIDWAKQKKEKDDYLCG